MKKINLLTFFIVLSSFCFSFSVQAQACANPTNLVITDNQDGSITFSWDIAVPPPALGYAYSVVPFGYTPNPNTDFTLGGTNPVTVTQTYNAAALVNGNTYTVYIASLCSFTSAGYASDNVTINIPVTACSPVANLDTLNSDFSAGTIDVGFTSSATEFEVQVFDNTLNTNYFVTPNPTTNPFTLSGLNHGYNYTIRMRAICGVGDTSSAVVYTFDFGTLPCQQPLNVVVVDNNDGTITLSWVEPIPAPAQGIAVSVMPQGGFPTTAADITFPVTSPITLSSTNAGSSLTHGTTYSVYVGSVCNLTNNDMAIVSNTVTIFNPAPCDSVQNLIIMPNNNGSFNISWSAVVPAPGAGYGYAVVPTGVSLVPLDYKSTNNTSLSNISSTTQSTSAPLLNNATYDVYVRTQCYHNPVWYSDTIVRKVTITNIGIEENEINLTVYPNPTTENVYVNATNIDYTNAVIEIMDVTGKVLRTQKMVSDITEIHTANLFAGIYLVKVQSGTNMKVIKIVKN